MSAAQPHISNVVSEMERALERMTNRSSTTASQMMSPTLVPETRQDIEHYVYDLLARKG